MKTALLLAILGVLVVANYDRVMPAYVVVDGSTRKPCFMAPDALSRAFCSGISSLQREAGIR